MAAEAPIWPRASPPTSKSPARLAARRFLRHRAAVFGAVTLGIITLAVILAPWIAPYGETELVGDPRTETINFLPPQSEYWFGTDSIGRDMYSLILWGGRVSLFIGVAVAISSAIIGTLIGAFAGFRGGKFDDFLMRFTDLFLAFPLLVALLVIRQLPEKQAWARTGLRGDHLDPADDHPARRRVVDAHGPHRARPGPVAEGEGVHRGRPGAGRHQLAPDLASPHPQLHRTHHRGATFTVAAAIITESTLSFFGFGVQPPHVSWGNLLAGSKSYVGQGKWWLVVFPSLALLLTVLAVNFIGDGLRDALDPKQAKERA